MEITKHEAIANADRHAALAGAWLMSLGSENTRRAYRRDLLGLFDFLDAGGLNALDAERRHLDAYRLSLAGAPSSVARRLAAASSFYSYAADEGKVQGNPVARVKRPKIDADHSTTRGLTEGEARALLDAASAHDSRAYAFVALLLLTGVRTSEALNANVGDLSHDAGHSVLFVTRKGGKRAKIALPPTVVEAFSRMLSTSRSNGTEVETFGALADDVPLFATEWFGRWASSEAYRTVQRLARHAGIEGSVSPHSLRHTHATLALEDGVTLADLQDSLGHADPRTTRRYDRARGRLERSSAYTVARRLG